MWRHINTLNCLLNWKSSDVGRCFTQQKHTVRIFVFFPEWYLGFFTGQTVQRNDILYNVKWLIFDGIYFLGARACVCVRLCVRVCVSIWVWWSFRCPVEWETALTLVSLLQMHNFCFSGWSWTSFCFAFLTIYLFYILKINNPQIMTNTSRRVWAWRL